jgi:pyruvate formate lyase activating enzyme
MRIGGFQPFSLSDYPGIPASVIFTQGCNWNCSYCHNAQLIPATSKNTNIYDFDTLVAHLDQRKKVIKGVVFTGGEPTLQKDLKQALHTVKQLDLHVKLDTNGTHPDMLEKIIAADCVDFIAMDIKAPWAKYETITRHICCRQTLLRSMHIIAQSGKTHMFRTTFDTHLLTPSDIEAIRLIIPENSPYTVQPCNDPASSR